MLNLLSRLYFTHMGADGGANSLPLLEDEPIHQCMERSVRTWRMPNWFRPYYFSGSSSAVCSFLLSSIVLVEYAILRRIQSGEFTQPSFF